MICIGVMGATLLSGPGGAAAATTGSGEGAAAAGAVSCIFWNSQKLMVCATPSSVMVKSLAVRPSMGLPLLSVTLTVSTTNWVLLWNLTVPLAGVGGFCVVCCACTASMASRHKDNTTTDLSRR